QRNSSWVTVVTLARRQLGSLPSTCLLGREGRLAESSIPAAVRAAAREFGAAVAVAEPGGVTLTYRELLDGVRGVAGALIASGVAPGDRVAIWSPNTHHW